MKLHLKELLNPQQYRGASILHGPLLIIAGAGSGKTRVITYRIANMLQQGIAQKSILALTFTNKAAQEMEQRICAHTGTPARQLTVSTFHAFGLSIIQRHAAKLGYRGKLTVFDTQDIASLIKESAREIKFSEDRLDVYGIAAHFSRIKSGMASWEGESLRWKKLFHEYQAHLKAYQAVDFDDLISLPISLFTSHPEVLEEYQERFQYILVDEFQDTSRIQYTFLKMIAQRYRNICVVGDDDQSIYSWRGADYENISSFEKDFPEVTEIKLEQNYRSTGTILSAANQVIANNKKRKPKSLWTGEQQGYPLRLVCPEDEADEAAFIASKIRELKYAKSLRYDAFGILVRTNALMSTIEAELLAEQIPYTVSGGQSFFARKEVKDVIAYLRILAQPHNDLDFLRIINTPRRGLGKSTIEHIRHAADEGGSSLFSAARQLVSSESSRLPDRSKKPLLELLDLIEETSDSIRGSSSISAVLKSLLERIEYRQYLIGEHPKNPQLGQWKYGNAERFLQFLAQWQQDSDQKNSSLFDLINKVSLTGKQEPASQEGRVNLMTIHASKGLEFTCVFLPAVEQDIIPHGRSIEEGPGALEEERRLFYVALTRARQILYLSCCSTRKVMNEKRTCIPSPFLDEVPKELFSSEEPEIKPDDQTDFFAALRSQLTGG